MKQARIKHMKKSCAASLGMAAVLLTLLAIDESKAETAVVVPQRCGNGVCGSTKYYGGRVRIQLATQLTRISHFNFKTNPGDQIELGPGGGDTPLTTSRETVGHIVLKRAAELRCRFQSAPGGRRLTGRS
jgi:hypothetical protein